MTDESKTLEELQTYHDNNAQLIEAVRCARDDWATAEDRAKEAKTVAKGKRARLDEAVADLLAFGGADSLPFKMTEPDPPAWRDTRLDDADEFDIPAATAAKLIDAGLETAGALTDFCQEHGEFWGQDINGIGPTAQQAIENAWEAFWEAHPEHAETEIATDAPAADIAAVAQRIDAIQVPDIACGKKADALAAIAACTALEILKAAQTQGLTGDWRRAAVAQRIDAINEGDEPTSESRS